MGSDNLPVVNLDRCTGCGACERICPKHIITLTSNTRRVQGEYTTDVCTAPCQRTCPAGIDIPAYIREIREGRYLEAVRVIKETNPFPLVCGRICVHPCEYECRRNLVDEPVAINYLKRFAADYEMRSGQRIQIPRASETGKRVAVVGGGAEGLTAAYFMNRLGHEATVYEASSQLGGLLRSGIAENRLPTDVLDHEIKGVFEAGVQTLTDQKLGRDFTVESLLRNGSSAVFVATGGWDTLWSERENDRSSQPLPGVQVLLDFILKQRAGQRPSMGKHVMIMGGGRAALEAARIRIQEGAEGVHLIFRKRRDLAPYSREELEKAEQEGIQFHFESALTKMIGEGSKLTEVEIAPLSASGQESAEGQRETFPIDLLLMGAGRFPELIYVSRKAGEDLGAEGAEGPILWETLVPYASPYAEEDFGIFRPGEVTSDYRAVVEAIGAGRRAASSVQKFLTGEIVEGPDHMIRKGMRVLNVEQLEPVSEGLREPMPERSQEEQIADPDAEIALGYSEEQAIREAKRCLQCGLICYRRMTHQGLH